MGLAWLSGRWQAFDCYLSARCPVVWRTGLVLWTAAGAVATALGGGYAAATALSTETVPMLSSMRALSTWLSILGGAALLVLLVDVIRKVGLITSWSQAGRVYLCTTAAALAILLPQYTLGRIGLTRIAALESHEDLQAVMQFHGQYGYWHCLAFDPSEQVKANGPRIQADLLRYGLRTDLEVSSSWWCNGASVDSFDLNVAPAPGSTSFDQLEASELFGERVDAIDAAQRYVASAPGSYPFPLMGHIAWVIGPAMLTGALAVFAGVTLIAWLRTLAGARRGLPRLMWRPVALARPDQYVAARWPVVWSSRLLSPGLLMTPILAGFLIESIVSDRGVVDSLIVWVACAGAVFIRVRSQSIMRYLPSRLSHEICGLIAHAVLFVTVTVAFPWGLVLPAKRLLQFDLMALGDSDTEVIAFTFWAACLGAALLQSARLGSAVATLTAAFVAGAIGTAAIWLTLAAGVLKSEDGSILLGSTVAVILSSGATCLVVRYAAPPGVQRLAVATLLLLTCPLTVATSVVLMPTVSDVTAPKFAASVLATLGTTMLVLRVTEHARRTLALTYK